MPFPFPGDLPDPGIEPGSPALQADALPSEPPFRYDLNPMPYDYTVEVMELQLSYSNPKRQCCESAALNMPANLENSAVAMGLEKVSFNFNPKERQCRRMLKVKVKSLSRVRLCATPRVL